MTINELRTPVNSSKFSALLPEATLREVIEPLERALRLRGVIAVYDLRGEWQYGPVACEQVVHEASILVDGQEIGTVVACFLHEQDDMQDTLDYLAHVLSLLASETARRRHQSCPALR